MVSRSNAKSATNLARYRDLSLARDLGLLLHAFLYSLLYHDFLTLTAGLPLFLEFHDLTVFVRKGQLMAEPYPLAK